MPNPKPPDMSNSIRFAENNGLYLLQFIGDIRVTLCASFDSFIDTMFNDTSLKNIILDLSQAQNIDSTALGMIAKISAKSASYLKLAPITLSTNPDIDRILECMGLPQVLNIVEKLDEEALRGTKINLSALKAEDIPQKEESCDEVCHKVIEAHRILMDLNDNNRLEFQDLVTNLEKELSKPSN